MGFQPNFLYFEPKMCGKGIPPNADDEILKVEELECIRLKDYLRMDQAAAAERMGISQPTFHRIISESHRKVAQALVEGKAIRIEGGNYVIVVKDPETPVPLQDPRMSPCGWGRKRGNRPQG